ncbi:MAG TPA: hypothetical protein VJ793_11205 [Anaerolineae bacterium]|nr:hypothetical protein [Anaerolineae bacterium]
MSRQTQLPALNISLSRASLGNPNWWSDHRILGERWLPPAGGKRYGLARFPFSLRPNVKESVRQAELAVYCHAKGAGAHPVVFDLFPKALTEDQIGEFSIGIGPDFKFAGVEASVAKAETKFNLKQSIPVLTADGIGESVARWVFIAGSTHPLVGSQVVYAILELPPGVEAARVSLLLSAEVEMRFGLLRGRLPETERARLSWVLE